MSLAIDSQRLLSEIEALALISDAEPPAVTRIVFTPTDLRARAWLIEKCQAAGLAVRQDPIGNTFARWAGSDAGAPWSALAPTSMQSQTRENMMEWLASSGGLRQYALCKRVDFVPEIQLSCCFLPRKSQHASESDAWAAGSFQAAFLQKRLGS